MPDNDDEEDADADASAAADANSGDDVEAPGADAAVESPIVVSTASSPAALPLPSAQLLQDDQDAPPLTLLAALGTLAVAGALGGKEKSAEQGGAWPPSSIVPPQGQPSGRSPTMAVRGAVMTMDHDVPWSRLGLIDVEGLEPDALWWFSLDGTTWQQGSGARITRDQLGADGRKTVWVYQEDVAGNHSDPVSLTFELDTVAPLKPTLALKHDTGTAGDNRSHEVTLVVTGLATNEGWSFSTDGGNTWRPGAGDEIADSVFDRDGRHEVLVKVTDRAGNETLSDAFHFERHTVAPSGLPTIELSNDSGTRGDLLTNDARLLFGDLDPGAVWSIQLLGSDVWITAPAPDDLEMTDATIFPHDGRWTVRYRQVNDVGLAGPQGLFDFTLDTSPPERPRLTLNDTGRDPADGITSDPRVGVVLPADGVRWRYRTDLDPVVRAGTGSEVPWHSLVEGRNTVYVQAADAAGNWSLAASLTFELDRSIPLPPALTLPMSAAAAGSVL